MTMDNNPFKAAVHDGVQTYYGTADDRVRMVAMFDRAQCEAALQLPQLQKTVTTAVQQRLRYLDKVVAVLHFEDYGQDFLRWELDANGKVIGCAPFQASIWCGNHVFNPQALQAGDIVFFWSQGEPEVRSIRYLLKKVVRLGYDDVDMEVMG